jgi:signal transduction histidine kinase
MVALGLSGAFGGMLAGTAFTIALRRSFLLTEKRLRTTAEQLGQAANPGQLFPTGRETVDAVEQMTVSATAIIKRLRHSENDALRAEQLAWVGQMAAGIAHEIRNPLMSIKLLVQATSERSNASGFRPRDFQVLEEEIARLEKIVSGFLDFARPTRPEAQPFELATLVERVVDGVQARADSQGVNISIESAVGATIVTADPNQIRQILFNLLFNALDAQPQGGRIEVRMRIDRPADCTPQLELQVQDAGPGLPEDLGDQIFDPFVSTKETGMGLGLSICRRIAEAHGGSLKARSLPAGALFTLRLPMPVPDGPTYATTNVLTGASIA